MRGMNQKRKRLGLWILFLAALLLTQFTVPVKASEPQIQDVNIQMVGGQIRTIDPMGLRMVACIKKSYIQELEKSGATVSYGIVLLPKKYLTEGQALTLDGKYLYNGSVYKPAKVPAVKKFSEDNERIYFTAVLANLPKERYKNDYAARAYAEITRTVTEDDGKKKVDGVAYNVPGRASIVLKQEKEILFEDEVPVTQFGTVEYLAPTLFNKNSTVKVTFNPVTGGLVKVDREENK